MPPFDDINVRKAVVAASTAKRSASSAAASWSARSPTTSSCRRARVRGGGRRRRVRPRLPRRPERRSRAGGGVLPQGRLRERQVRGRRGDPDGRRERRRRQAGRRGRSATCSSSSASRSTSGRCRRDTCIREVLRGPGVEVRTSAPTVGWIKDFNDAQAILDVPFNGDAIEPVNNSNWPQLDVPAVNKAIDEARLVTDPAERAQAWGEVDRHDHGAGAGDPVHLGLPAERPVGERERGDQPVQRDLGPRRSPR